MLGVLNKPPHQRCKGGWHLSHEREKQKGYSCCTPIKWWFVAYMIMLVGIFYSFFLFDCCFWFVLSIFPMYLLFFHTFTHMFSLWWCREYAGKVVERNVANPNPPRVSCVKSTFALSHLSMFSACHTHTSIPVFAPFYNLFPRLYVCLCVPCASFCCGCSWLKSPLTICHLSYGANGLIATAIW